MFEGSCTPTLFYPLPRECPKLIGVAFEFMKRIPAQFCVERALRPVERQTLGPEGLFVPEIPGGDDSDSILGLSSESKADRHLFIETSSGNMATGLAEVCRAHEIRLHLLLPFKVDEGTRHTLAELKATIEIIQTTDQNARIKRLAEIKKEREAEGWTVSWVQQYTNPNNRISYWRLAEFLASEFDWIDQLVAAVGTGGSSCGTAGYLRRAGFPDLKLVGVDACGSINFGHTPGPFLLGGLGSSRPMPLVDHSAYDVVHWVDDATAFAAAISLFESGVPVGGSSGAAFLAARHEAERMPEHVVLVIFPDHARRYADTIRSENWRQAHEIDLNGAKTKPVDVSRPDQSDPKQPGIEPGWYRIDWRSYYVAKTEPKASVGRRLKRRTNGAPHGISA
jgi:cysteine synthase A